MRLAFIGNQPEDLPFGELEKSAKGIGMKEMMHAEIIEYVSMGYDTFIYGCSRGAGIIFAEQVLLMKTTEYPHIRLISVLPYTGYADEWSDTWKKRYNRLLEHSDTVVTLSPIYTEDCTNTRNRYLVDNADKLLSVYNGSDTGEIVDTIQYAIKQSRGVVIINPNTLKRTCILPSSKSSK